MTVLLPDGDSLIPTFENDPDYIELDRAPTGQRVFERRTGGRMKQITVTLHEGAPPNECYIIGIGAEPLIRGLEIPAVSAFWVSERGELDSDELHYYMVTGDLRGYILMDDLQAAVEAALKEGE